MIRYHLRYHHAFHLIVSVTEENKDDGSSHRWCGSRRMAARTSSPPSACAQVLVSQQEDTIQYCNRLFNVTVEHCF